MGDWLNQGWWGQLVTPETVIRHAPEDTCPSCRSTGSTWVFEHPTGCSWVCSECQDGGSDTDS